MTAARRLHHIALGAEDVEAVARFYCDVFALPELERQHSPDGSLRSIWLDLGGTILMIERATGPRPVATDGGLQLLAFGVRPEERGWFERKLSELGAPIEARTVFTSYARDPEQNRVAISHYPAPPVG